MKALLKEAREALVLVTRAWGVHHPDGTQASLKIAGKKAEEALCRGGHP